MSMTATTRNDLTADFVRSVLDYDPATGALSWKRSSDRHNPFKGKTINFISSRGYIICRICGRNYKAHRVIWFMMTSAWPADQIDHISGVRNDNRWTNLREATRSENCRNAKVRNTNTSGRKGVNWNIKSKKWEASISLNGKRKYLGGFDDIVDAAAAYENAATELFGEFKRQS